MDAFKAAEIYVEMSKLCGDPEQLRAYYVAMEPNCTYAAFLAAAVILRPKSLRFINRY